MTKTKQTRIGLIYPINFGRSDDKFPALEILIQHLGHTIFYHLVYEKGLAYYTCVYQYCQDNSGAIIIEFISSPENLEEIRKEIKQLVLQLKLDAETISRSVKMLIGYLTFSSETLSEQVKVIAESILETGKTETIEEHIERIKKVTVSSVVDLYNQFLANKTPQEVSLAL